MNEKFKSYFMSVAKLTSELSYAERNKVGAVLVRDKRILLTGYNGTPAGFDNCCEEFFDDKMVTKPIVSHAEENLILYAAKTGISLIDSELFITLSPCHVCARLIFGAGIKKVYYNNHYRDTSGLDYLSMVGIEYEQYN